MQNNRFRPILSPFQLILNNFDFFPFFLGGGDAKKTFLTNFLAISGNIEQLLFFLLTTNSRYPIFLSQSTRALFELELELKLAISVFGEGGMYKRERVPPSPQVDI